MLTIFRLPAIPIDAIAEHQRAREREEARHMQAVVARIVHDSYADGAANPRRGGEAAASVLRCGRTAK